MDQNSKASRQQPEVMERYGKLPEMDRSFDIEFWQRQGPAAIFEAAWQMAIEVHARRTGTPDEPRMLKSVESFQRIGR